MNRRASLAVLLYAAVVSYLSLYPWHFASEPGPGLQWVFPGSLRRTLLDALLNVGFYVPLGVSATLAFGRRRSAPVLATVIGVLLSFGIEMLQRYLPGRFCSYVDLITNSVGTAIGAAAVSAFRARFPRGLHFAHPERWQITRTGALLVGLWCLARTFPFLPTLSLYRLGDAARALLSPSVSMADLGLGFIALFVIGVAVEGRVWVALAWCVVPLEAIIMQHNLSLGVLFGATAGLGAASLLPRRIATRIAPVVFMLWLVADELRPFQFGPAQSFDWLPFFGMMTGAPDTYFQVIFLKLFVYAAAVWVMRVNKAPWAAAIGLPAAILVAGEAAQCYLPGRTPETTDFILLLGAAGLVRAVEGAGGSRARPAAERP